ncbi:MAG: acetylglutamate kinase [Candidatus Eisenbacteria bacterium]
MVVKIGGRALEAPAAAGELAAGVKDLAAAGHRVVLIHGGGAEVSEWCARLGIESHFHNGLRVSDPETLAVATAVLAGLANKRLVARLRAAGLDAVGLAALDGGIASLVLHPDSEALGAVGAVESIAPALLDTLLERGAIPVLASIGARDGRLLNLNADDLAAAVAPAVRARTLLLLSDTPGLKLAGAMVPSLDAAGIEAALTHPDVQGGMSPKLRAARAAIEAGVTRVVIAAWQGPGTLAQLLTGLAAGTVLMRTSAKEAAHG